MRALVMYKLTKANKEAVKYACLKFHYAKSIPVNTHWYNVYYNDERCGVILYWTWANNNIAKWFWLSQWEVIELVRVALNWKQKEVSKPLAISLKLIKKDCPNVKVIVSYADIDQWHEWIIYKATNRLYVWTTYINKFSAFIINWKKTHPKSVHWKGIKQNIESVRKYLDPNAEKYYCKWKHKYIYIYDKIIKIKNYKYPENESDYVSI